ncbi:MAG: phosphatidate cytidylyltransferase [Pseudomonadota bacterium]
MSDQSLSSYLSARWSSKSFKDLRPRVLSGITMLAGSLFFLFIGAIPFAILVFVVSLVMSWEWGRLVRGHSADRSYLVHATAVATAILLAITGQHQLAILAIALGATALFCLNLGTTAGLSAFGVAYVGIPAIVLVFLRGETMEGALAVLFVFIVVWSADIAAFVGGRLVGGYKLWPSVSPNKTWAGFVFGVLASMCAALIFATFVTGAGLIYSGAIGLAFGILSQAGDLAESALKRGHGVKDASDLIPGHGGVMDRMDGIVIVASVAVVMALMIDASAPAHALLFGP